MIRNEQIKNKISKNPKHWLITGVAGFIGSNLLEVLLDLDQTVIGLDNFSTGHRNNLDDVRKQVGENSWKRFSFNTGDIRNLDDCRAACKGVDYVLHHAAFISVPLSIDEPILANQSNVDGFLNMLVASRDAKIKRFVYATSSATYGDQTILPSREDIIGKPLSPYAVTKYVNELYADIFARIYRMECIGLRYFNIYGKRQDPKGGYASVIPRWIGELMGGNSPTINGDGETSRDFCYIDDVVQANLLAATTTNIKAVNHIYNIAVGEQVTLNELLRVMCEKLRVYNYDLDNISPVYRPFRPGDIRHSQADISKAKAFLSYEPVYDIKNGIEAVVKWFNDKERVVLSTSIKS